MKYTGFVAMGRKDQKKQEEGLGNGKCQISPKEDFK